MRMERSLTLAVGMALLFTVGAQSAAHANPGGDRGAASLSSSQQTQLVNQFADRVRSKWKLDVNAGDYRSQVDGNSLLILPKDSPAPRHLTVRGVDMLAVPGVAAPSSPRPGVRPLDNPSWNQPTCYSRIDLFSKLDPSKVVGWADACYQTGTVTYDNQLGWDALLKEWQTCASTGADGLQYNLTACNMGFAPGSSGDEFLSWDDWSPKSTVTQSPCASVTLSVSVGGIGGSLGINLCDTLSPVKGTSPLDFQANWSGRAPTGQSRETGDIIGVNDALFSSFGFQVLYGGIGLNL
jgi:hypothetical protein